MVHRIGDRILETTTVTGTGNATFLGAQVGYNTVDSFCTSNGDTIDLVIGWATNAGVKEYEYGRFTRVSAGVYSRATPWASSNGGAATSFTAGTKEVWSDIGAFFLEHLNTVPIALTSAATFDIGAQQCLRIDSSGTTGPVTSLGTAKNKLRIVKWSGQTLTAGASIVLLGVASGSNRGTSPGDVSIMSSDNSSVWTELTFSPIAGALARGYIDGFTMSRNAGTPTTKLDVAAGECRDDTNSVNIKWTATKTLDFNVNGANGSDTGSLANAWHHVFAIMKADGTTAVFSGSNNPSPTLPTGYIYKHILGTVLISAANQLVDFTQDGDEFMWKVPVSDVTATAPGTAAVTRTVTVCPHRRVKARLTVVGSGNVTADDPVAIYISDLSNTDVAATVATGALNTAVYSGAAAILFAGTMVEVWTNTSGQVRSRLQVSGATTILYIGTHGWTDKRGKNA